MSITAYDDDGGALFVGMTKEEASKLLEGRRMMTQMGNGQVIYFFVGTQEEQRAALATLGEVEMEGEGDANTSH